MPSWPEQKALSLQIMPVVQKGAKVLVTGANGFIGAATIKILVERGFNVIDRLYRFRHFTSLNF